MPLFLKDFTDSKFTISLVLSLAGVSGLIIPPTVGYLRSVAKELNVMKFLAAQFSWWLAFWIASGQICGPLIGGKVIDTFGYRWLFPCAAPFLVIGLILLQFVRSPAASAETSDSPPA